MKVQKKKSGSLFGPFFFPVLTTSITEPLVCSWTNKHLVSTPCVPSTMLDVAITNAVRWTVMQAGSQSRDEAGQQTSYSRTTWEMMPQRYVDITGHLMPKWTALAKTRMERELIIDCRITRKTKNMKRTGKSRIGTTLLNKGPMLHYP